MDDVLLALQHEADQAIEAGEGLSPWSINILYRLKDYIAIIITPLKLRVRTLSIYLVSHDRIEIRVVGTTVLQVVFSHAELLASEIAFLRQSAIKKLTTPQIITADITYNLIPVGVLVCTHNAGVSLCDLEDETMQRIGARQVGRLLRSIHTQKMPGWGAPSVMNAWDMPNWRDALRKWLNMVTPIQDYTSTAMKTATYRLWHELISDEYLASVQPVCIHGDVECQNIYVTIQNHVQLEGLVRPGFLVAGDAMFDLASIMRGSVSVAVRQGVIEGYTSTIPLRTDEVARIKRLTVLWRITDLIDQDDVSEPELADSIHAALDAMLKH